MKLFLKYLPVIFFILAFAGCHNNNYKGPSIDKSELTSTPVPIHRYGKDLFNADTSDFFNEVKELSKTYGLFTGTNITSPDQVVPLFEYITDTQLVSLSKLVKTKFDDIKWLEDELSQAFSRYHYFFPEMSLPEVYSYISDIYYENPVAVNHGVMVIALDVYLGKDTPQYSGLGLPYYKIKTMEPDYIIVDAMKAMYDYQLDPRFDQRTLIDRMIGAGKQLFFLDAVLPDVNDSTKIRYTSSQMKWIENNKENVWGFMVSNKLFYSSDYDTQTKLIQDGPFTTGFSNDSPPRTGVWLGWQIVREYMRNNPDITLEELINTKDSQIIFNNSGYKP